MIKTATVSGAGETSFTVPYTKAGTYCYTVTEQAGDAPGWSYDSTGYTVIVTVTDENADLKAEITGIQRVKAKGDDAENNESSIVFVNSYNPKAVTVSIPVRKTITGIETTDEVFSFILTDAENQNIDIIGIKGAGVNSFKGITYDKTGTYEYTITETTGNAAGWTYDTTKYAVTVEVANVNNVLQAAITKLEANGEEVHMQAAYNGDIIEGVGNGIVFSNVYKPDPATISIPVQKIVTGSRIPTTEFTFTLTDEEGKTKTATITGAGTTSFEDIAYDQEGIYTYIVTEQDDDVRYWTYDNSKWIVVVCVEDVGGRLDAKITNTTPKTAYNNDSESDTGEMIVVFTNSYKGPSSSSSSSSSGSSSSSSKPKPKPDSKPEPEPESEAEPEPTPEPEAVPEPNPEAEQNHNPETDIPRPDTTQTNSSSNTQEGNEPPDTSESTTNTNSNNIATGENPLINVPNETIVIVPPTDTPLTETPDTSVTESEVPKTSDDLALWLMLALFSGVGLAILGYQKIRDKRKTTDD